MPKFLKYSLRFPFQRKPFSSDTWKTDLLYESYDYEIRLGSLDFGGDPSYYLAQFLHIQNAIAVAFVDMNQSFNMTFSMPEIRMQRFPTPALIAHPFANLPFVPILFLLSLTYNFVNTVRFIAIEKESQLKETMKIMGLSNWMHYSSWFIRSIVILLINVIIITIFLTVFLPNVFFPLFIQRYQCKCFLLGANYWENGHLSEHQILLFVDFPHHLLHFIDRFGICYLCIFHEIEISN